MRLDKFLKVSRIIKRRPVAKQACDAGRVKVNDAVAGAGKQIKTGDILEVRLRGGKLVVRVERLAKTVRKEEAQSLYTVLETTGAAEDLFDF
ncbi:MAG: RNA-binding S4 domain-containing protein [Candidatus Coatesbacteria bacterium]|nr:RNA-binding S4 domain-containing protein [Candidatus Coatesbacteria bacterium]